MSRFIFLPTTAAPDAGADIGRQTAVTLARLDERLRADRPSLADAVGITVYLRNPSDFPAMNERAAFGEKTAMTPVKAALAAAGARVEIMTLAERG